MYVRAGILVLIPVLVLLVGVKSASIRSNRIRRTIPSTHLLIGYWGQNGAGPSVGAANYERPLTWFCQNSKYDIINLAFLVTFFDSRNADSLPGLNFAFHCGGGVTPQHPYLLRCPAIEEGITTCQQNGKKVLLSLGGATGGNVLGSADIAVQFANTLWQLFLGGNEANMSLRPFGTAILDGIDLNIEGGSHQHFPDLIREIRRLMNTDSSKSYLVTSAPQCPHPDRWLGPQTPGTALEDTGELTNYTFIQFYNNPCWTGAGQSFESSLTQWLSFSERKNVGIMIGIPAHPRASSQTQYHRDVDELRTLYDEIRSRVGVSGIMLWDCSWDQNNLVNGKMYSEHVREILDDTPTPQPGTTTPPPDTTTPPSDTTTPPPDTTTPPPDTTTPLPDTTTPPPDTTTPPPDTTTPPPDTTTPPPDTTTPPPDTTTPPPDTTPPLPSTTPAMTKVPTTKTTPPPLDTTTTQPPIPGTTTSPSIPDTFCQGKVWGDYKHPFDCTKFITCAPNGLHIRSCPAGLRFNSQYRVCDWPQNVPC